MLREVTGHREVTRGASGHAERGQGSSRGVGRDRDRGEGRVV